MVILLRADEAIEQSTQFLYVFCCSA